MMKLTSILAIAVIAGTGVAAQVSAQTPPSRAPIMYGANTGEYTPSGISLRGDAEILQGQNRLRAEAVEVTMTNGAITRIEASGGVYYVTPNQTLRGDRATYSVSEGVVTVTGDVILTQGRNVLTGTVGTYNIDSGEARLSGGTGGRVQGVLYPEQN
ncbi:LptA/OstA family protein [Brevundimonas sp.]|jgi:lipopolysaccharide export system protein LptA|uniref:LptA/OstA family protein n=2 Tax=Brevundimonas sp. TaxID=1871086 RepID=UPI00391D2566